MGGFGSGRWMRDRSTRVPVEQCYAIDVNELLRAGTLRQGTSFVIKWSTTELNEIIKTARISVEAAHNSLRLRYTITDYEGGSQDYNYAISLSWVLCYYGGKRPYFLCPGVVNGVSCRRRVAKLYKPPAGRYFLCRNCYNLTYYSCNESGDLHFTARRRTKRAARKLGLRDPDDVYTMDRPKGMHEKTFRRRQQDVIDVIEREHWAFGIVIRRFAHSLK
jgi:hypothetical protein